jgi:ATPase family protein associated with various cellular activities (AAA)/winged helix domain-containing protein
MSPDEWLEANNRYLAASLRWLRLRLRRLVPEVPVPVAVEAPAVPTATASAAEPPGLFRRWLGARAAEAPEVRLLTEGTPQPLEEQITAAAAEREAAARMDPPPALLLLAERFDLSAFERDTLLLCAAAEFDPGLASTFALTQGSQARPWPTFGLALSLLDDPAWEAVAAHRPLRYVRLLEINQPGGTPLTSSALRADERIVNFLKGLNALDDRLATLLDPVPEGAAEALADSQRSVVEAVLRRLRDAVAESILPVVQLTGGHADSRLAVASLVCTALNRRLYRLGAEGLLSQITDLDTLARLWQRETLLLPVALFISVENPDGLAGEIQVALRRFLSRGAGLIFLGAQESTVDLAVANFAVEVKRAPAAEQFALWTETLREAAAEAEVRQVAASLAGQFDLGRGDIQAVAARELGTVGETGTLGEQLWDACRDLTRPRLDALAQRLELKATWDDLVLPEEQMALMRRIAGQVRARHQVYDEWGFSRRMNRGFGISALFAGESGTGKTMAAEVLANDLRLYLYRIDLSAVVSKYIGETEKNLRKLFDAAEQGGAILFFDEADALFGKRSEVKDSHDRYANIEINYLLQRMEAFSGLAILATNMKSALDPAFLRRLRFVVNLPVPAVKDRKLIWERSLPTETPSRDLDFERLARLNLTGGNIHSIALNAAFAAAQNGQTVTMPIVLAAARAELRKLDKPVHEAEFR